LPAKSARINPISPGSQGSRPLDSPRFRHRTMISHTPSHRIPWATLPDMERRLQRPLSLPAQPQAGQAPARGMAHTSRSKALYGCQVLFRSFGAPTARERQPAGTGRRSTGAFGLAPVGVRNPRAAFHWARSRFTLRPKRPAARWATAATCPEMALILVICQ